MTPYSYLFNHIKVSRKHDGNFKADAGDEHCHQSVELLYLTEGEPEFVIENIRYSLHPGDIIIVMPSRYHYVEADNASVYERYVIKFDTAVFPEYCIRLLSSYAPHFPVRSRETAALFAKMDSYAKQYKGESLEAMLFASIIELIVSLKQDACRAESPGTSVNARFSAILDYINTHLDGDLSLDSLSELFFQSKTWLYNAFKSGVGASPAEYIASKRIAYAHQLILDGEKPTAVFERCGYADYSSFYRAYTAKMHQPPSAERVSPPLALK